MQAADTAETRQQQCTSLCMPPWVPLCLLYSISSIVSAKRVFTSPQTFAKKVSFGCYSRVFAEPPSPCRPKLKLWPIGQLASWPSRLGFMSDLYTRLTSPASVIMIIVLYGFLPGSGCTSPLEGTATKHTQCLTRWAYLCNPCTWATDQQMRCWPVLLCRPDCRWCSTQGPQEQFAFQWVHILGASGV